MLSRNSAQVFPRWDTCYCHPQQQLVEGSNPQFPPETTLMLPQPDNLNTLAISISPLPLVIISRLLFCSGTETSATISRGSTSNWESSICNTVIGSFLSCLL